MNKPTFNNISLSLPASPLTVIVSFGQVASPPGLPVNDTGYLEKRVVNVLAFSTLQSLFCGEKESCTEIIHHVGLNPAYGCHPSFDISLISVADPLSGEVTNQDACFRFSIGSAARKVYKFEF